MSETGNPHDPFIPQNKLVGESQTSNIYGFQNQKPENLVLKKFKAGSPGFSQTGEVMADIQGSRKSRAELRQELVSLGSSPALVPDEYYVIHNSEELGTTYTRTQREFVNSKTMSKTNPFNLSHQALVDLKNIALANIGIWKKTGQLSDILGSSKRKDPLPKKILRNILPLFYSENIIIDNTGQIRFIDTGTLKPIGSPLKWSAMSALRKLGTYTSLLFIDGLLLLKGGRGEKKLVSERKIS